MLKKAAGRNGSHGSSNAENIVKGASGIGIIEGIEILELRYLEQGERARIYVKAYDADRAYMEAVSLPEIKITAGDPSVLHVEQDEIVGVGEGSTNVTVTATAKDGQAFAKMFPVGVMAKKECLRFAEHPRILFTEEECRSLQRRIASPDNEALRIDVRTIWEKLRQEGDLYLEESGFQVTYANASDVIHVAYPLEQPAPLPDPPGYIDYPFWTMYSRGIEHRLITLSLMYALTKDLRYANIAKAMLYDLAHFHRWYEFPHRGAEGNLSNAHFTLGVATAYDTLYAILSEGERRTIRAAILEKGLRPMAIDFGNADQHNIIVAKQVAMMIGALAIADEEPAAALYIRQTHQYMRSYLDSRVEAEETEGLMYNNIAAGHLAQAAAALKKTTGDASLIEHPFLTVVVPEQFFYFQSTGNQPTFANLSDSHPKLDLAYMMSMLAEYASNGAAMWYVQHYEANRQAVLLNVIHGTEAIPPERYFAGRISKVFARIGWAALRSGWGMKDHLIAFTSSPSSRGHNHLDQNHFIMNVAGEWLITDPGYQDYRPGPKHEFTDGSVGHNVLMVNGAGQRIRGGGQLTEWHTSPGFDAVRGDATVCYDGAIRQWHRTVAHADMSYIVIIDDIALNHQDDCAELLLHTTANIQQAGAEDIGKFTIQGERASVLVCTAASGGAEAEITRYAGAEEYGPYLVFRLNTDEHGRARFITLLVPNPNEAEAPLDTGHDEWQVEWSGEETVIIVGERDRLRVAATGALEWMRLPEGAAEPEAYALFGGRSLRVNDKELLSFTRPASGTVTREGSGYTVAVTLPSACRMRLAVPSAAKVRRLHGEDTLDSYWEDDAIVIDLPAGEHRLTVSV